MTLRACMEGLTSQCLNRVPRSLQSAHQLPVVWLWGGAAAFLRQLWVPLSYRSFSWGWVGKVR